MEVFGFVADVFAAYGRNQDSIYQSSAFVRQYGKFLILGHSLNFSYCLLRIIIGHYLLAYLYFCSAQEE